MPPRLPADAASPRVAILTVLLLSVSCSTNPQEPSQESRETLAWPVSLSDSSSCACGDTVWADVTLTANLLDCSGDGLVIGADGVTVNGAGFTIRGAAAAGSAGIRLAGRSQVSVLNLTVTGFDKGVSLDDGAGGNSILGCTLFRNGTGISATESPGNIYRGNVIRDHADPAIELRFGSGDNLIVDNTLERGHSALYAFGSSGGNTIRDNRIAQNRYGVRMYSGSGDNVIEGNRIQDHRYPGITLESSTRQTVGNIVRDNLLLDNSVGVRLMNSNGNIIEDNTVSRCGYGIDFAEGSWGGPPSSGNTVSGNRFEGGSTGINCRYGVGNSITENQFAGSTERALWFTECGNHVSGNTGSGDLPIVYSDRPDNLMLAEVAGLIICGVSRWEADHVMVGGTHPGFGILIIDSDNVSLTGSECANSPEGLRAVNCSNLSVAGSRFHDNLFGMHLEGVRGSRITGNVLRDNTLGGARLRDSTENAFWGNLFQGTWLASEDETSTGNSWTVDGAGNFWSDFASNPGYPHEYRIDGFGGGVDTAPITDEDGDGHPAGRDCDDTDPDVHPGAGEVCNGRDDDCNGAVDECDCARVSRSAPAIPD